MSSPSYLSRLLAVAALLPVLVGGLCLLGESAGYYDGHAGFVLFAVANAVLSCVVAWLYRRAADRVNVRIRTIDAALAESTLQFTQLVRSVRDYGICMLDRDGYVRTWNAGAEHITGYEDHEVLGKSFEVLLASKDDLGEWLATASRESRLERQVACVRKGNAPFWGNIVLNPIRDETGALDAYALIIRDITAWRHAEIRAQENADHMRSVVENVVDGIVTIDERGFIMAVNPAAERLFGYSASHLLGKNVNVLMPESYAVLHDGFIQSYLATGIRKVIGVGREVSGKRADGSTFPMDLAIGEFHQSGRRFFTGVVRDITYRREVEQRSREAARRDQEILERRVAERTDALSQSNTALQVTVGELKDSREQLRRLSQRLHATQEKERSRIAREVHDELGQMLAVMKLELVRLKSRPELLNEQVQALMDAVDMTIAKLRRISSDLRPIVLEQLGLAAALEWLTRDVTKRTGVQCSLRFDADLKEVESELATGLFRIVQEAITNALKHSGSTAIDVAVLRKPKSLALRVRDYGRGISREDRGRSSSLGLVGMAERALDLGGTATVEAAEAGGTIVAVDIPWPQEEPSHA